MATALITGASGGIGKELALGFAEKGFDLVLVSRSQEKLEEVASEAKERFHVEALVLPKDLSQESFCDELAKELGEKGIEIDLLVNNAGFGDNSPFLEANYDKLDSMVRLNISALMRLSYLFGSEMKERGKGKILNVASCAAFSSGPNMATYYASKAFVLSFSQSLSVELKPYGVTVTCLCPGPTETGFEKAAGMNNSLMFSHPQSAKKVAKLGVKATLKGKDVVYSGPITKGYNLLARLLPRKTAARLAYSVNKNERK